MILLIFLFLSLMATAIMGWLLIRATKRLLQFDDLIDMLVHDMETNIKYFDKLTSTPVLSDVQEIQDANRNMNIMSRRLDEYLSQFEDLTLRPIRKETVPRPPKVA